MDELSIWDKTLRLICEIEKKKEKNGDRRAGILLKSSVGEKEAFISAFSTLVGLSSLWKVGNLPRDVYQACANDIRKFIVISKLIGSILKIVPNVNYDGSNGKPLEPIHIMTQMTSTLLASIRNHTIEHIHFGIKIFELLSERLFQLQRKYSSAKLERVEGDQLESLRQGLIRFDRAFLKRILYKHDDWEVLFRICHIFQAVGWLNKKFIVAATQAISTYEKIIDALEILAVPHKKAIDSINEKRLSDAQIVWSDNFGAIITNFLRAPDAVKKITPFLQGLSDYQCLESIISYLRGDVGKLLVLAQYPEAHIDIGIQLFALLQKNSLSDPKSVAQILCNYNNWAILLRVCEVFEAARLLNTDNITKVVYNIPTCKKIIGALELFDYAGILTQDDDFGWFTAAFYQAPDDAERLTPLFKVLLPEDKAILDADGLRCIWSNREFFRGEEGEEVLFLFSSISEEGMPWFYRILLEFLEVMPASKDVKGMSLAQFFLEKNSNTFADLRTASPTAALGDDVDSPTIPPVPGLSRRSTADSTEQPITPVDEVVTFSLFKRGACASPDPSLPSSNSSSVSTIKPR